MSKTKNTCILLEFNIGGHVEEYAPGQYERFRFIGHCLTPEEWDPDPHTGYPDGVPVLDKRQVLDRDISTIFESPDLGAGNIRNGSYPAFWARQGARVGSIRNNTIEWHH